MARPGDNERFNLQFAEELSELKLKLQLVADAVNALDGALRGTFELLIDQGLLAPEAAGVKEFHRTMMKLRKLGLPSPDSQVAVQVACPRCRAMLKVRGAPGDRCEWCGHIF